MLTTVRWSESSESENGVRPPISSLSFSPAGDLIASSSGTRVLLYAAGTGTLMNSLKGHTDSVYGVDFSHDGKQVASCGADQAVIIWTSKGDGVLKFQHKSSVQAVAWSPVTQKLISVSGVDWGLWEPGQAKVQKKPLTAKGLCVAWTDDGQHFAIGQLDGSVVIMTEAGEETKRIRRSAPVWTIGFNPKRDNGQFTLVVGSWDQRLSFYNLSGAATNKERELDFDPCCVSFYENGEYILLSGGNHQVALYTRDGNRLVTVAEADDWVWACRQRPKSNQIVCCTNDGSISSIEVSTSVVHCLYVDRYVVREGLTNVVINYLSQDKKMTIPCNDYVKRLATFRTHLAVQFEERVLIFLIDRDDSGVWFYKDIAQIRKRVDCDMLCVTDDAVLLCKDKRLTMLDFQGNKRREWSLESPITFIKVDGGANGQELVLIGLQNGQSLEIFVDNPFPTMLVKVDAPIRCLDLNSTRTRLAVVDENNKLQVFNLKNKGELLFSEKDVNAVCYNVVFEDILAYTTGNSTLNVKTGSLPPYQQSIRGLVVGFKANSIFNLHYTSMMVLNVPHAHALYRYIEDKDFDAAYRIAALGITDSEWKMLGMHALTQLQLDVAQKSFTRIHESRFVELLYALQLRKRQLGAATTAAEEGEKNATLGADILAFQGKYQDASRMFLKSGNENRAIEMFCDLKMWDDAKKVCSDEGHLKELIRQQARWAEDSENYVEAATLYETCGDYPKAISMMGRAGQLDKLMKLCRTLPKSEVALITECASFFREHDAVNYALEAYEKVGDHRALIQVYVEMGNWRQAFAILEKNPQYARDVYVPWAQWLAENSKFEEALQAFRAAKWPQEATRLMETSASNSVTCRKFRDAAFYYVHLASEYGEFEDQEKPTEMQKAARIKKSNECIRRADIYYAFYLVHTYSSGVVPRKDRVLFNAAKYLLALCSKDTIPMNVGKGEILYALAEVAKRLEMIRTARTVFENLQTVILPVAIMNRVDVETLVVRSKPLADDEALLDLCYRCKQVVPQLTNPGDVCPNCYHPFVRSFVGFEVLPLVEFTIEDGLSDADVERVIVSGLGGRNKKRKGEDGEDDEENNGPTTEWQADTGANVINFESDNIDYQIDQQLVAMGRSKAAANKGGDPFFTQLQYALRPGRPKNVYQPFIATMDVIKSFRRDEVVIVKPRYGTLTVPNKYYRIMKPDVHITVCEGCQHLFTSEDYELECTKGNGCPLCRFRPGQQIARSLHETMLAMEAASNSTM